MNYEKLSAPGDIYCQVWIIHDYYDFTWENWINFDTSYLDRKDGPVLKYRNGMEHWYLNGKLHRTDGPALERPDGSRIWALNGKRLPTQQVEEWIKQNNINLSTQLGQLAFKLRWL